MITLTPTEKKNYDKYLKPNSHQHMPLDQPILKYPENSKRHEMGKINIAFMILEMGNHFVMEAQERLSGGRIRDVVDITEGICYEIELDSHRANRHKDAHIQVIRVDHKGRIIKCKECKNFARYIKYNKGFCKEHYIPTSPTEQNQKWYGGL